MLAGLIRRPVRAAQKLEIFGFLVSCDDGVAWRLKFCGARARG